MAFGSAPYGHPVSGTAETLATLDRDRVVAFHDTFFRPDNATLLKLYALFKQGSNGDASGDRPGVTDFVARAKWDAWHELSGTTMDDAKRQYIDLIEDLKDA